ncbi:MAG: cell division protein FtsQ/DivIB [Anaerolineae bacterium]
MVRLRGKRRSQRRLGTIAYQSYTDVYRDSVQTMQLQRLSTFDGRRLSKLLAGVLLVLLAWSFYLLFSSSSFYVSQIEVNGNTLTSLSEISLAAELEGMSIFWVDPEIVKVRVEALPYVKRAEVHVTLPAQVVVTVEERIPQLVWRSSNDEKVWWIDTEGVVLEPRGILEGALVVTDESAQPLILEAGQRLDPSILASVRALHALLPDLREVTYEANWGIGFRTGEGWPIYLGSEHQMAFKLAILKELRRQMIERRTTPRYIDLRFPPDARFQIER